MKISDERIHAIQEAYKKDFGEEIPKSEALEMYQRLVFYYELVSRSLPEKGREEGHGLTPLSDHPVQSTP